MISDDCKSYEIITFILIGAAIQAFIVLLFAPVFGRSTDHVQLFFNLFKFLISLFKFPFNFLFQLDRGACNGLLLCLLSCLGGCLDLCERLLGFCDGICKVPSSEDVGQDAEVGFSNEEEIVTGAETSFGLEDDMVQGGRAADLEAR